MTATSSNRYIHLDLNGEYRGKVVIDLDVYLPTSNKRVDRLRDLIERCPEPLRTLNHQKVMNYLKDHIEGQHITKIVTMYYKNYQHLLDE